MRSDTSDGGLRMSLVSQCKEKTYGSQQIFTTSGFADAGVEGCAKKRGGRKWTVKDRNGPFGHFTVPDTSSAEDLSIESV